MNLRQELRDLSEAAPPPAGVDTLLRLARRRKRRRASGTGLAAAIAMVAVFLPAWQRHNAPPAEPFTETHTVLTVRSVTPVNLEVKRRPLTSRILALGLGSPHFTLLDVRTLEIDIAGEVDQNLLRSIILPHPLHVRRVLNSVPQRADRAPGAGRATTLDQLITELGDAYQAALTIRHPQQIDEVTTSRLAAFGSLSGAQIELLPAEIQFAVPQVTCAHLRARPTFVGLPLFEKITTCFGQEKVFLDVAQISGDDVAYAQARELSVHVGLTEPGQARMAQLTGQLPATSCAPGRCLLAYSLGPYLVDILEVTGALSTGFELTGGSREQAIGMAQVLSAGDPPNPLAVVSVEVRQVIASP